MHALKIATTKVRPSLCPAPSSELRMPLLSRPLQAGLMLTRLKSEQECALDEFDGRQTLPSSQLATVEAPEKRRRRRGERRELQVASPRHPEDKAPLQLPAADVAKLFSPGMTTVMVKNISNRFNCEEVLCEIVAAGFEGSFDFFYLPIDFSTKRNRGYCFLNFKTHLDAQRFVLRFHGQKLRRYTTKKILEIAPATTQGLDANMKYFKGKDGPRVKNQWFRPMVFGVDSEDHGVE
ncbi:unnamed protein product [Effrenium voratum]|nr:unnamed protein product [Effrenium voratum]